MDTPPIFDYKVFGLFEVINHFRVTAANSEPGAYRSQNLIDNEIDQALRDGYRWVRSDDVYAIFEKSNEILQVYARTEEMPHYGL